PDMTVRVVRDIFNEDFSKVIVSGDEASAAGAHPSRDAAAAWRARRTAGAPPVRRGRSRPSYR
ncbi:hypothetical protein ABT076_33450, partial [Streptomyces sp. NPDC002131]|uniref:hypothetical protein n=1 Tax=Streptomyces sp. NPDC002131 TaxID=3154535 RepID=UPI00332C9626